MGTLRTATGDRVLRAYARATRGLTNTALSASVSSAGFIIRNGQKPGTREGWQVFVKVIRYSDAKLKNDPMSGGLAMEP